MSLNKKGLGRGFESLLGPDDSVNFDEVRQIIELPIAELHAGRYQPRTDWAEEPLEELAASIRREGVISPVIVRPSGLGYEIIAGERRTRAAKLAGLDRVPAIVRDVDDRRAAAMALIENIQREDLNPIEEAEGIKRLMDEFEFTHEEAANAVGRSRSGTTNLLRLLTLEEDVKGSLRRGEIDMGHARALLGLTGAAQSEAAKAVREKGLSVRQTETLVRRRREGAPQPRRRVVIKIKDDEKSGAPLEEALSAELAADVSITASAKGRGRIVIAFENPEQLTSIVRRIRG